MIQFVNLKVNLGLLVSIPDYYYLNILKKNHSKIESYSIIIRLRILPKKTNFLIYVLLNLF
jgi:hypothetical protein